MDSLASRLIENIRGLRDRIAAAAERSGRKSSEVKLIAVTKYVDDQVTSAIIAAGCTDIGESRPQDLWQKAEANRNPQPNWHLIGHLQRNKVRRTLPLVSLIHSVDSLRLLEEINRQALSLGLSAAVLLEANVSGDATKHGFDPGELPELFPQTIAFPNVRVLGLMTMASREGDLAQARDEFCRLRQLRDELQRIAPHHSLSELSMGMSGDFEVAIEEGATMVRIGSALFEGIN